KITFFAHDVANSVTLLNFQIRISDSQNVTEEISLRHTSHILFFFIQHGYGSISVRTKAFQSLTDRIIFMEEHGGNFRNHDFDNVHSVITSPKFRPASNSL